MLSHYYIIPESTLHLGKRSRGENEKTTALCLAESAMVFSFSPRGVINNWVPYLAITGGEWPPRINSLKQLVK